MDDYNAGGYGEGDDYNAGGYGNEDLFGAGVGTRDFLSMGPGSSAQGGYAGFTAGAYSNSGSSSLRPSRLDFDGLDLNSEHGWSEVQALLRGDEVQGSDLPPPIRVPPRGQHRTLGLWGPRSGRGGGRTAAAGGRRSGGTAAASAHGGRSAPFGRPDQPARYPPAGPESAAADQATTGGGRRRRRASLVSSPLSSQCRFCSYEFLVYH